MANIETTRAGVATTTHVNDDRSYVDWPAILAGTVLATSISFVLLTFGSALGLSLTSARPGSGVSLFWLSIVAALWLLWVQISSFMAGGYLTGRMRRRIGDATEHESDVRDGSHGLIVWALGVIVAAFIAFTGVSGAFSVASGAAGAIGAGVGSVVEEVSDQFGADSLLVDQALRPGPRQTQPVDQGIRGEVGRILLSTLDDGEMAEADRSYLVAIISARAGIPPEEAEQRLDQIVEQGRRLEAEAREAAETARRIALVAAFITAASLLISAVGAYWAATLGGKHRDERTVFEDWSRRW